VVGSALQMSENARYDKDLFELTRQRIACDSLVERVRAGEDGAIVTFDGCVRNHSHGRSTLYLEYEGYEAMALVKLREIGQLVHEKFAIDRVAIVHRLGRLEIGESSVFIAVSAAHRAGAFEACRWAIDTLKQTVPIWKKEFFADGAVWADGELPPAPGNATGKSARTIKTEVSVAARTAEPAS
jgi:MoaE-MoaD fusion protein